MLILHYPVFYVIEETCQVLCRWTRYVFTSCNKPEVVSATNGKRRVGTSAEFEKQGQKIPCIYIRLTYIYIFFFTAKKLTYGVIKNPGSFRKNVFMF
jgi:hypothetical protein